MKVTVALITYNRPHLLKYAIEAILNQTFYDFEFLIMDNGSTEETQNLIKKYTDKRIKYLRNEKNSRDFGNRPFEIATGQYLIITHDDDIMHPDLLRKEVEVLDNNPDIITVSSNICIIDQNNSIQKEKLFNINKLKIFGQYEYLKYFLNGKIGIICPTVMIRKKFFNENKLNYEVEKVGPAADNYLWIKVNLSNKKMAILSDVLYSYRVHSSQDSMINEFSMNFQLYNSLFELFTIEKIFKFKYLIILRIIIIQIKILKTKKISEKEYMQNLNLIHIPRHNILKYTIMEMNKFIAFNWPNIALIFLRIQNRFYMKLI